MSEPADEFRAGRLCDVAATAVDQRDPGAVFDWILGAACTLTGARYAALGVLNEQRDGLRHFHATGIDDDAHRAIGNPPRGRGVLGVLIRDPKPLRLTNLTAHPSSYGFPAHHPAMTTFLGVPIELRGEIVGNLYLAEKDAGAFTARDEEVAVLLAGWTAKAIDAVSATRRNRLSDAGE